MACRWEGKLVKYLRNPSYGIGLVEGPSYTKRFMSPEDWDMVHGGMGEYAGSYGTAINVIFPSVGKTIKGVDVANIEIVQSADPHFGEITQ